MNLITSYKKNTAFHTTLINCIFQFNCDKNEIMAFSILSRLLAKTNKKYPEVDLFVREKLNRYIMNLSVSNQSINDVYFLNFSMLLPNSDVIKEDNITSSINFLLDTIYDVNKENKETINYNNTLVDCEEPYEAILDLTELKITLESCAEQYLNINFGDGSAFIITRGNVANVIAECRLD